MSKKLLLSLDDLYNFYVSQGKNVSFNSQDENKTIVVHLLEPYRFEKNVDDELNLKTHLRFCHTEINKNHSRISKKSMENAIPSAYNIPILGYVYKNDDGEYVFAGHERYIDEDGETVYEEIPVGTVPESANLELLYDEDKDKYYLEGDGVIWKIYSKAAEILEREKTLSVSVELYIDSLSYSAEDKILNIDAFRFTGVTILQEDRNTGREVIPAMEGAEISIENFDEKHNAVFTEELLKELKQFNLNFQNMRKEGKDNMNDEKKEVLQEQEQKEELLQEEVDKDKNEENKAEIQDEETDLSDVENIDNCSINCSMSYGDNKVDFAVSLSDQLYALSQLVNSQYENDNTWYSVDAYTEPTKYVVMQDIFSGKAYKQDYKIRKGDYQLVGDRIEVYSQFLTKDEIDSLDDMRKNYSVIEDKLSKYESEPEKLQTLNSDEYSSIFEADEYKELAKRENYFDLSKDELVEKLDSILLSYAKQKKLDFSVDKKIEENNEKTHNKMRFSYMPIINGSQTKKSRYGNPFNR